MTSRRRGLTVLELLIIIILVVVAVVLLLRWRGGSDDSTPPAATEVSLDSAGALVPSAVAGATRLAFLAPVDSVATAGDTVTVRLRATAENGVAVTDATVRFAVAAGGGALSATSSVTGLDGETELRWILGTEAGSQVIRATIDGDANSMVSLELSTAARTPSSP